jgi:hypothetical protein
MVALICAACSADFEKPRKHVERAKRRRAQNNFYCSTACVGRSQKRTLFGVCERCGNDFARPSCGKKTTELKFCSITCSSANALIHAHRAREASKRVRNVCPDCGSYKNRASKRCALCYGDGIRRRTLGELRLKHGTAAFHAKIRGAARNVYKGLRECAACGYRLHVDICHIRDVASFPASATVAEVNDRANLIALDKRCHWEFDNGYLFLDTKKSGGCPIRTASPSYESGVIPQLHHTRQKHDSDSPRAGRDNPPHTAPDCVRRQGLEP